MADKTKKKDVKKAPAEEPKPVAPVAPESKAEEKTTLAPLPQRGALGRRKPRPALLSALASATGTSPIVLAALRAAYGWTDRTRITRREFLRKRDEWLARPASEV